MDEIRAGDLVMVVRGRPCCGQPRNGDYGTTFRVARLIPGEKFCPHCAAPVQCGRAIPDDGLSGGYNVNRLQKLPPATEPESIEVTERVTA